MWICPLYPHLSFRGTQGKFSFYSALNIIDFQPPWSLKDLIFLFRTFPMKSTWNKYPIISRRDNNGVIIVRMLNYQQHSIEVRNRSADNGPPDSQQLAPGSLLGEASCNIYLYTKCYARRNLKVTNKIELVDLFSNWKILRLEWLAPLKNLMRLFVNINTFGS